MKMSRAQWDRVARERAAWIHNSIMAFCESLYQKAGDASYTGDMEEMMNRGIAHRLRCDATRFEEYEGQRATLHEVERILREMEP